MLLAACDPVSGPPISAENIDIVAPIPGTTTAVAYLDIRNTSGSTVTITQVTSPQFGSISIHETTIADGVATMRPVKSLMIADGDTLRLQPGGLHLMLLRPVAQSGPVTLRFHSGDSLLLSVDADMRPVSD